MDWIKRNPEKAGVLIPFIFMLVCIVSSWIVDLEKITYKLLDYLK